LGSVSPSLPWRSEFCQTCPVPEILLANACPNMILEPAITRPFPFVKKQVQVRVACSKSSSRDFDPHTGCGQCHPLPPEFRGDIH
jgi:hypothetical protein